MGEARNQWASRLAQVEKRGKAPLVNRGGSVSCGSLSCEPLSLGSQCSSLVSSRATMVRTKADSVPGTYRKGEAIRRGLGCGVQGRVPLTSPAQAPNLRVEAAEKAV